MSAALQISLPLAEGAGASVAGLAVQGFSRKRKGSVAP